MIGVRSLLVLAALSILCGLPSIKAGAQDKPLNNRFDREAVIRPAKEYKF